MIRLLTRCFLIVSISSATAGCVSFQSNASKHSVVDRGGLDIVIEDASKKATIFKDPSSTERYCRTPNPDYAAAKGAGVSIPTGIGSSVGLQSGGSVDSLGGRSPSVLIAREMMYRACEMSLNLNADKDLTIEIYKTFMGIISEAMRSQTEDGVGSSSARAPAMEPTNGPVSSSSGPPHYSAPLSASAPPIPPPHISPPSSAPPRTTSPSLPPVGFPPR